MSTQVFIVVTLITTPGFFLQESGSPKQTVSAGYVFEVKGTCYIRDDDKPQPRKLTPQNANGTKLRIGQKLLCDAGGSLKFKFSQSGSDVAIMPQSPPVWYEIPNVPARALRGNTDASGGSRPGGRIAEYKDIPSMREASQPEQAAGSEAGVAEHATSGMVAPSPVIWITSPAQRVVYPETLVFRWKSTYENNVPVALSLQSEKTNELIWKQDNVAINSGELVSEEARATLKQFRDKNPDVGLRFSISRRGTVLAYNVFKLISVKEEKTLKEELSELDKREDFLRLIGRADAFAQRGLYAESAREYEQALEASPESEDLQIAVIFAQCRAGNYERTREIGRNSEKFYSVWTTACILGSRKR